MLALMIDAQARSHAPSSSLRSKIVVGNDGRIDSCASLGRAGAACACNCAPAPQIAGPVTP